MVIFHPLLISAEIDKCFNFSRADTMFWGTSPEIITGAVAGTLIFLVSYQGVFFLRGIILSVASIVAGVLGADFLLRWAQPCPLRGLWFRQRWGH